MRPASRPAVTGATAATGSPTPARRPPWKPCDLGPPARVPSRGPDHQGQGSLPPVQRSAPRGTSRPAAGVVCLSRCPSPRKRFVQDFTNRFRGNAGQQRRPDPGNLRVLGRPQPLGRTPREATWRSVFRRRAASPTPWQLPPCSANNRCHRRRDLVGACGRKRGGRTSGGQIGRIQCEADAFQIRCRRGQQLGSRNQK